MNASFRLTIACPCGSQLAYADCCGRLHAGAAADHGLQLMRSRYSAFVLGNESYLLATWHERTRPATLSLDEQPTPAWLGLKIVRHDQQDATHERVEFVARFRVGGGRAQRLHELSRFERVDGRWYYLDGDVTKP